MSNRPRQKSARTLERDVAKFNERFPVGAAVEYRSHPVALPMRSYVVEPAFVLGCHTACAFIRGVSSAVAVDALSGLRGPLLAETSNV